MLFSIIICQIPFSFDYDVNVHFIVCLNVNKNTFNGMNVHFFYIISKMRFLILKIQRKNIFT